MEGTRQEDEIRLGEFSGSRGQAYGDEKVSDRKKGATQFRHGDIRYDTASETAREETRTAKPRVRATRYYRLLLAEGHLTRRLFGAMVRRIEALALLAG